MVSHFPTSRDRDGTPRSMCLLRVMCLLHVGIVVETIRTCEAKWPPRVCWLQRTYVPTSHASRAKNVLCDVYFIAVPQLTLSRTDGASRATRLISPRPCAHASAAAGAPSGADGGREPATGRCASYGADGGRSQVRLEKFYVRFSLALMDKSISTSHVRSSQTRTVVRCRAK